MLSQPVHTVGLTTIASPNQSNIQLTNYLPLGAHPTSDECKCHSPFGSDSGRESTYTGSSGDSSRNQPIFAACDRTISPQRRPVQPVNHVHESHTADIPVNPNLSVVTNSTIRYPCCRTVQPTDNSFEYTKEFDQFNIVHENVRQHVTNYQILQHTCSGSSMALARWQSSQYHTPSLRPSLCDSGSSNGQLICRCMDESPGFMKPDQQSVDEDNQLCYWLHSIGLLRLYPWLSNAGFSLTTLTRTTPEELNACGVTNPQDRQNLRAQLTCLRLPSDEVCNKQLPKNVQELLRQLHLEFYLPHLREQGYTNLESFIRLTCEDLEEIGVIKLGHQKKLLLAIDRIRRQSKQRKKDHDPNRDMTHDLQNRCSRSIYRNTDESECETELETQSNPEWSPISAHNSDIERIDFQDKRNSADHVCEFTHREVDEQISPLGSIEFYHKKMRGASSTSNVTNESFNLPLSNRTASMGHTDLGIESKSNTYSRSHQRRSSSTKLGDASIKDFHTDSCVLTGISLPDRYQPESDPDLKAMNEMTDLLDALSEDLKFF